MKSLQELRTRRILVCGGRDYYDEAHIYYTLNRIHMLRVPTDGPPGFRDRSPFDVVITGGAKGADTVAHRWAKAHHHPTLVFNAEWDKYGKRAGYLRNKQMLDEGKPDLVIAFPGGKGTAMMIKLAEEAGVEVIVV